MKTDLSRHSLPLEDVTQVGTSATLHTDDVKNMSGIWSWVLIGRLSSHILMVKIYTETVNRS